MTETDKHIERTLTDVRIAVESGFAAVNARLDATKDHEQRIRDLENTNAKQLTRDDVAKIVSDALNSARRPRWQDVGALIVAIATATGLVLTVARALGAGV